MKGGKRERAVGRNGVEKGEEKERWDRHVNEYKREVVLPFSSWKIFVD